MNGCLPSKIQWRVGKSNLTPGFISNLINKDSGLVEATVHELHPRLKEWINEDELKRQWCEFSRNPYCSNNKYYLNIYNCMVLHTWLTKGGA
jgi:hypothetical protein